MVTRRLVLATAFLPLAQGSKRPGERPDPPEDLAARVTRLEQLVAELTTTQRDRACLRRSARLLDRATRGAR